MNDVISFLETIPETSIPWCGFAGMVLIFLGAKSSSFIFRIIVITVGIGLFIVTFLWMLRWFMVF